MNKISKITAAALLGLLNISTANAGTSSETVKAGKTTQIYAYAVYEQTNCRYSLPVKFSSPKTKHGTLTSRRGSFTPTSGQCKGIPVKSTNVYYTPNKGFRGTETVRFRMVYDKYRNLPGPMESKSFRIKITVK